MSVCTSVGIFQCLSVHLYVSQYVHMSVIMPYIFQYVHVIHYVSALFGALIPILRVLLAFFHVSWFKYSLLL